ncbi:hypothetical protein YC2023_099124 [Brassica napus]
MASTNALSSTSVLCSSRHVKGKLSGGNQQKGQRVSYRKASRGFSVRASIKEISFDQSSRPSLQARIDKFADDVGLTLGPRGIRYNLNETFLRLMLPHHIYRGGKSYYVSLSINVDLIKWKTNKC